MRQFVALRKVYELPLQRWAIQQATIANAPHFQRTDKTAYIHDDFLGKPRQSKRSADQEAIDSLLLMKAKVELSQLKKAKDTPPDFLPSWAVGEYFGPPKVSNG